jgi:hypothetical protein
MSSATDQETCNRNEYARNQAALHQRTPSNHAIHIYAPLGNNVSAQCNQQSRTNNEHAHAGA